MTPEDDKTTASDTSDDEEGGFGDMFPEEERPKTPPPSTTSFPLPSTNPHHPSALTIHLVSNNPLWGHLLWNAALSISSYMSEPEIASFIVRGKNVVEFGAGGGLPSLVAAGLGARKVVVTDYPEDVLLKNLERNVRENGEKGLLTLPGTDSEGWKKDFLVKGHIWGKKPQELIEGCLDGDEGYDLLILSDLIFNHSQHLALLSSMASLIRPSPPLNTPINPLTASCDPSQPEDSSALPTNYTPSPTPPEGTPLPTASTPRALIFFSHHLPMHLHRDLLFFYRAEQRGWAFRRVVRETKWGVMFEEDTDKGKKEVREVVEGWEMWRA